MVYTVTDKEQIEELKTWWRDYGQAIAIAVVIGLLIGFGWRYWQRHEKREDSMASNIYERVLMATTAKQYGLAERYTEQLRKQFDDTVYASLASLMQARTDVTNKKYTQADVQLSWVVAHGETKALRQIARIRDARVLMQIKQYDKAVAVLAKVDDKGFTPMIENTQGMLYQAQGKSAQAKTAFKKAEQAYKVAGLNDPILEYRLSS